MRTILKSEREGVEYSSTSRHSLFDRGCAYDLKTIDRTAIIVSTLYWRSVLKVSFRLLRFRYINESIIFGVKEGMIRKEGLLL